jgi:hypothetical protein
MNNRGGEGARLGLPDIDDGFLFRLCEAVAKRRQRQGFVVCGQNGLKRGEGGGPLISAISWLNAPFCARFGHRPLRNIPYGKNLNFQTISRRIGASVKL